MLHRESLDCALPPPSVRRRPHQMFHRSADKSGTRRSRSCLVFLFEEMGEEKKHKISIKKNLLNIDTFGIPRSWVYWRIFF